MVEHVSVHLLSVLALRRVEAWLLSEVHSTVWLRELRGATLRLIGGHDRRLILALRLRRHDLLIHWGHVREISIRIKAHLEVARLIKHTLHLMRIILRHISLEILKVIWVVLVVELIHIRWHLRHTHVVLGHLVLHVLHHLHVHVLLHVLREI